MTIREIGFWVVVLDQVSKVLVERHYALDQSVTLVPGWLYLTYVQNMGVAFGFMADLPAAVRVPFFILVTLIAEVVVYAYQRMLPPEKWLQRVCLGLIAGGAIGNFVDHIWRGRVVDFIDARYHEHQWYVFNVADSCITVGVTGLILAHLFKKRV